MLSEARLALLVLLWLVWRPLSVGCEACVLGWRAQRAQPQILGRLFERSGEVAE
jgi:hypothetical protein